MIADHPWFGTGQGTFAYAFPSYRSSDISLWGIWDIAHNTPLEIAADMGVPIAVLVLFAWLVIFAVLASGTVRRRRGLALPVAALAVALLAALHSLIDFTLQIPGYSIAVLPLVGAGLAQSIGGESSPRDALRFVTSAGVRPSHRPEAALVSAKARISPESSVT
jgi:O-antigen ligase